MRKRTSIGAGRFWMPRLRSITTYANERLEWQAGCFWLVHADRRAGTMLWREDIGLWEFVPTTGDTGCLRRTRLTVVQGLNWLITQTYDPTVEPEEFVEEIMAQLDHSGAH
jgi:hypothetical protein